MTLILALTVGFLFGAGAYLALKPDLLRMVVGMVLVSQASVLTVIASGLVRGQAPILPLGGKRPSDPLAQALSLTAIVIGMAVTALLLVIVYRVYTSHRTVDLDELAAAEVEREAAMEREEVSA